MDIKNYNDPGLKEILEKILPAFQPTHVYLFGSRSQNNLNSKSDYDLFFVIPDSNINQTERGQKAIELTWRLGHSIDYFIYTQSEFDSWKHEINSIAHSAFTKGLELEIV